MSKPIPHHNQGALFWCGTRPLEDRDVNLPPPRMIKASVGHTTRVLDRTFHDPHDHRADTDRKHIRTCRLVDKQGTQQASSLDVKWVSLTFAPSRVELSRLLSVQIGRSGAIDLARSAVVRGARQACSVSSPHRVFVADRSRSLATNRQFRDLTVPSHPSERHPSPLSFQGDGVESLRSRCEHARVCLLAGWCLDRATCVRIAPAPQSKDGLSRPDDPRLWEHFQLPVHRTGL